MTAQEHPEPVEPVMTSVPGGIFCLVHGVMDCTEPFCWRCGNHQMDDFERCADPRCRASNDLRARLIAEEVKRRWHNGPAPIEAIAFAIGEDFYVRGPILFTTVSPSFLVPGEPDRGGESEPPVPTVGAGPEKPMAASLPEIDSTRRVFPVKKRRP